MSLTEWQERMDKCNSKEEMDFLLKHKPKNCKTIMTGTPVIVNACDGKLPLLQRLMYGK